MRIYTLIAMMIWTTSASALEWNVSWVDSTKDEKHDHQLSDKAKHFWIGDAACGVGRVMSQKQFKIRKIYCMRKKVMMSTEVICGPNGYEFSEFIVYGDEFTNKIGTILLRCKP